MGAWVSNSLAGLRARTAGACAPEALLICEDDRRAGVNLRKTYARGSCHLYTDHDADSFTVLAEFVAESFSPGARARRDSWVGVDNVVTVSGSSCSD
jgi:hypothetical protein